MFHKKFTTIAIAAVIATLLLIGFVVKSEAASITSLSISAYTDYGSYGAVYASLSADEDIGYIDWYIKQTYPINDADNDYKHVTTSMYNSGTRSVSVDLGSYRGHIKIAEYDIKAEVTFLDGSDATSKASTSIYKPVYDSGTKETGIYGESELTSHHFDGASIVMCGYVYAYNYLGKFATGSGRFRHTEQNRGLSLEKDLPGARFKTTYSHCTSDFGLFFPTGGAIRKGAEWVCTTYLRLVVSNANDEDHWFAGDTNTFTHEDNR